MTKRVMQSGNINTGGQGDLYYYDGNRIIQQYAWMEVEGGGGGGGGCPPGIACKHRDSDNPELGLRDQLRPESDLSQRIAAAQAAGDATPAGLLRFMRPRSQLAADSEEADEDGSEETDKDARRQSVIPTKSIPIDAPSEIQTIASGTSQTQHAADNVYEINKANVEDPKNQRLETGPTEYAYQLYRTFTWGLDYIDELVFMADPWGMYYPLQDANYNVIAYEGGGLICQYDPYGRMRVRDPYASNSTWVDHEYNPNAPTSFDALPGINGRTQDRENGSIDFRNRFLRLPPFGRFGQPDPNGTGLVIASGMRYHGQRPKVHTWVRAQSQFTDGNNVYQFVRSNPNRFSDPTGMFSYMELASTSAIQGAMGGIINGTVSRFAGRSFWGGFATGAIGGALGGGAGYAFAASRAGFIGGAVAGRLAEGFVEGAAESFYNSHDLKSAIVDGLYGSAMSAATGGLISIGAREVKALGVLNQAKAWGGSLRRGAERPPVGPGSFRDELAERWGFRPHDGYHAHHVFPLEFADRFLAKGVEPEDVLFGAWWEATDHLDNSFEYNDLWEAFLDRDPSMEEILDYGRELSHQYGLQIGF